MPIVATALGRKFGVNVIVGGATASHTASTDGNTIWIPDLPPESALREVAWGFLAHEASHVRRTDMTVFRAAALQSPLQKTVLNILEDIRIEQAIRRAYPGTKKTLERVVDWMIDNRQLCAPGQQDHPASILTGYLLLTLRCRVLEQTALTAFAAQAEKVLRQTFPASTVRRLMGMTTEVPRLRSTTEANQLAERIIQLLKEEKQAAEPSQNDAKSDSEDSKGDSGDDSGGDSEDSEGNSGDDSEDAKGDSGDDSKDSKGDSGDDSEDAKGDSGGNSEGDSGKTSITLQQVLEAEENDLDQDLFETAKTLLTNASRRSGRQTVLPIGEDARLNPQGKRLLHDVRGESRALTAQLQGLVQSAQMDRPYAVHQGKKLVAHRLHRAGVGDSRLFARKTERTAPNTAVQVLIDLSGSMGNDYGGESLGEIAQNAALALALALDTIQGVSVAVTAFPGMFGEDEKVSRLIQHGQRPASRAGAFLQPARGGTPLTSALWYAAADLLQRQERKRVILVMTDGKPDDVIGATDIIQHCQATGIEIAGIGIKIDVSWLFPRHIQIDSPADLKQTLFGLAEQFLV